MELIVMQSSFSFSISIPAVVISSHLNSGNIGVPNLDSYLGRPRCLRPFSPHLIVFLDKSYGEVRRDPWLIVHTWRIVGLCKWPKSPTVKQIVQDQDDLNIRAENEQPVN